jgi:hypothetical protein
MTLIRNKTFLLSFLVVILVSFLLTSRLDQSIPGATSMELVAGCQLEFLDTTTQPNFTALLACPGKDYIRLWPLPVTQPWFEDLYETPAPRDELISSMNSVFSTELLNHWSRYDPRKA